MATKQVGEVDRRDRRWPACTAKPKSTSPIVALNMLAKERSAPNAFCNSAPGFLHPIEPVQDVLKLRRKLLRQRRVGIDLEQRGLAAVVFGDRFERVEQHGFADAAQAQHDGALGRTSALGADDRHARQFDQRIASGEIGRRDAGAWVVGIVGGFHNNVRPS